MADDAGKVRAFYEAAQQFIQRSAKLPGWRARIARLAQSTAGPWAPGTPEHRLHAQVIELERSQSGLEQRGAGLVAEVKNFLTRAAAGSRSSQGLGALPALPPLAALLLIAGIGAIAAVLASKLVGWLDNSEQHERQLDLAEQLAADVRAGRMQASEAAQILEASKPPNIVGDLKSAAGIILVGAAAIYLLPMLKRWVR
jgi:hypothetical protein